MGKTARVAGSILVFFCATQVALPQQPQPLSSVRDLSVSDIVIPADLGYIIETHQPADASSQPIIVHIQEAHTNYEAQQHLISILEGLVERFGLRLILVEGGEGDVSLAYLRAYGPPDNRKQVADKYLKAGVLNAEEYLDITSDYPLMLWGVEQEELYQQNVDAFLEVEALRESLQPVLALVRESGERLKPRLLDPALTDLQQQSSAFEQGTLELADYADLLNSLASRQGIGTTDYPNLSRFLSARALEESIQEEPIQQEQRALLARLSKQVTEAELDGLLEKANQVKAGTLPREAFYASLETLATTSGIPLESYPALFLYIRYLKESSQIDPPTLAQELDQLAASLRTSLADTPESHTLQTILDQLDLLEKLLDLRLSPDEYRRLQSINLDTLSASWESFLNPQLTRHGFSEQPFQRLSELTAALPTLQRFYEAANQRDDVLVAQAMAKLTETKEPLAVLITGGFHSPKITQLLKDRGVGLVVVAPKVTQATDERLYRAVLKYKSGHGSFEDVQAIANGTVSQFASQQ